MSYDRADFDYSTEEDPLPKGHAATHIGIFLAWAALHDLVNDFHRQQSTALLAKLRRREITGRQFFEATCNGKFSQRELSVEGNAFAEQYYADVPGQRGAYFDDYKAALTAKLPSIWHVTDTWENYDKMAPVIDRRYAEWRNPPKRHWWQFWK